MSHIVAKAIARPSRGDGHTALMFVQVCDGNIFDYVYHAWWRCRVCGLWKWRTP
jgi:hypothetical protein